MAFKGSREAVEELFRVFKGVVRGGGIFWASMGFFGLCSS
tara:strand:+ start:80 stop:199 length:120 start_codon:yes stop_codon:yes gene_type:complete